jgi:hypothetical protein
LKKKITKTKKGKKTKLKSMMWRNDEMGVKGRRKGMKIEEESTFDWSEKLSSGGMNEWMMKSCENRVVL